jgi:DNA polymerase III subunit epsilon
MSWHLGPIVTFDVESSGVNVDTDRIVTACVALVDGTGKRQPDVFDCLIDPGIEIPKGASDVHGWTNYRIQADPRAQEPKDGIPLIAEVLARLLAEEPAAPLVAFNAPFDLTILDRECRRNEVPTLSERLGVIPHDPIIRTRPDGRPLYVVDPFVLDKRVDRFRKGSRKLEAVCDHYGVRLDGAHDAAEDALAAARVAWMIAHRNPEIARMPLPELHRQQVGWKAEQAESFRDYLRRQGKQDGDVSGDWPFIPAASQMQIGAA